MKIIILKHAFYESPDYILKIIKKKKIDYNIINLYKNEKLPDIRSFDYLIIMGGPMGVYEEEKYPWLKKEKKFIKNAIVKNKKILGICLGAQLLAECLGGKVFKNKYKEIGWFPVVLTQAAKHSYVFKNIPTKFVTFHWHNDTFTLPRWCKHIAYSKACKNQAFIYKNNIIGLQFHPEITKDGLRSFLLNCKQKIIKDKYVQNKEKLSGNKKYILLNNLIIESIFKNFLVIQ
jgi:GMP synthase (glutamine-hydrolysing)